MVIWAIISQLDQPPGSLQVYFKMAPSVENQDQHTGLELKACWLCLPLAQMSLLFQNEKKGTG